jgi:hypothetical protein
MLRAAPMSSVRDDGAISAAEALACETPGSDSNIDIQSYLILNESKKKTE